MSLTGIKMNLTDILSKLSKIHLSKLIIRTVLFTIAAVFALGFLLPTVLTITNSFMSKVELNANYGMIFQGMAQGGGGSFVSESVTLKFIPDMVSFSQYVTALFRSPDYIFKTPLIPHKTVCCK